MWLPAPSDVQSTSHWAAGRGARLAHACVLMHIADGVRLGRTACITSHVTPGIHHKLFQRYSSPAPAKLVVLPCRWGHVPPHHPFASLMQLPRFDCECRRRESIPSAAHAVATCEPTNVFARCEGIYAPAAGAACTPSTHSNASIARTSAALTSISLDSLLLYTSWWLSCCKLIDESETSGCVAQALVVPGRDRSTSRKSRASVAVPFSSLQATVTCASEWSLSCVHETMIMPAVVTIIKHILYKHRPAAAGGHGPRPSSARLISCKSLCSQRALASGSLPLATHSLNLVPAAIQA